MHCRADPVLRPQEIACHSELTVPGFLVSALKHLLRDYGPGAAGYPLLSSPLKTNPKPERQRQSVSPVQGTLLLEFSPWNTARLSEVVDLKVAMDKCFKIDLVKPF